MRIRAGSDQVDAGGTPKPNEQLPVFIYDAANVTIDTNGFSNTVANFDTTEVPKWAEDPLSLVDGGAGIIYLVGLNAPDTGTVLMIR